MTGKLFLVATPIGNLDDMTFRAVKILKEVDLIAAEDTRHTLGLLNHFQISKPMISYHRHNEDMKTDILIDKLREGKNIALVSDAGTPGISDPGSEVVKQAISENIEIIPIPGACALINALITSGLDTTEFSFIGFLPLNKKNRKDKLEFIKKCSQTMILYEAPHKVKNTLNDLKEILQDRKIVLARELTKIHEEFIRGNVQDVLDSMGEPRGEYVILIEGALVIEETEQERLNNLSIEEHFKFYEIQGYSKKDIIKLIAKDRNVPKNDIYKLFLD